MPFFWSAHYDVSINYVGHAEKWDRVEVAGDAAKRDVAVRFIAAEALALATLFRDEESLRGELELERLTGAAAGAGVSRRALDKTGSRMTECCQDAKILSSRSQYF